MTTEHKSAVSAALLSSLDTAAASKQNIPYEITGRCVGLVVIVLDAPWGCAYACMFMKVIVERVGMVIVGSSLLLCQTFLQACRFTDRAAPR